MHCKSLPCNRHPRNMSRGERRKSARHSGRLFKDSSSRVKANCYEHYGRLYPGNNDMTPSQQPSFSTYYTFPSVVVHSESIKMYWWQKNWQRVSTIFTRDLKFQSTGLLAFFFKSIKVYSIKHSKIKTRGDSVLARWKKKCTKESCRHCKKASEEKTCLTRAH